jgi:hypothetical protein
MVDSAQSMIFAAVDPVMGSRIVGDYEDRRFAVVSLFLNVGADWGIDSVA